MRRLTLKRIENQGAETVTERESIEVPDSKLTVLVLRSFDLSYDAMQEIAKQAQAQLSDRHVLLIGLSPMDGFEIHQEE